VDVLEMDVFTSHDYGDHGHTEVLMSPSEIVFVVPSETCYGTTHKCIHGNPQDGVVITPALQEEAIAMREPIVAAIR
jgi:hypothetical protein